MSIFKKLFGLTSNTSSSKPKSREPLKGNPLEGQENEIHVKRIEKYTEGDTIIYFHFPGFERDLFSIKLIEDEFTKNKVVKPHGIHSYMADKVEMYSQYDTIFQIGLLSDKKANYITFGAYQKAIKFNLNDKVSILFDDEEIWEFSVSEKGYRVDKDTEGVIFETKTHITQKHLEKMSKVGMKKWRYSDEKNGKTYTNHIESSKKHRIIEMSIMQLLGVMEFINESE